MRNHFPVPSWEDVENDYEFEAYVFYEKGRMMMRVDVRLENDAKTQQVIPVLGDASSVMMLLLLSGNSSD